MKLRSARRLSLYLVLQKRLRVDIASYVLGLVEIRYDQKTRRYYCFHKKRVVAHRCAWGLINKFCRIYPPKYFEGHLVNEEMDLELYQFVEEKIYSHLEYVGEWPDPGLKLAKVTIDKEVKQLLEENPSPVDVSGYVHSADIDDQDLRSSAVTALAEKPFREFDFELFFDLFLRQAVYSPEEDGKLERHDVDMTIETMADVSVPDSAAGYFENGKTGTKKDKFYQAIGVIQQHEKLDRPPLLPYQPFMKPEVIKIGKRVRGIQIESICNYLTWKMITPYSNRRCYGQGRGLGLSCLNGDFRRIFLTWFLETDFEDYGEFLDWLDKQGAHESDKTQWEASTNITDAMAKLAVHVAQLGHLTHPKTVARAMTDYIYPYVYIGTGKAFMAPGRVASGSYLTSDWNTDRHIAMNNYVCDYMQEHGGFGGCDCTICSYLGLDEKLPVDDILIRLKRMAIIQGDDYLSVSCGYDDIFDKIMDFVFGTSTKTEVKPFFGNPGMVDTHSAKFLQRGFCREQNNIVCYKDPTRILAKLYHGDARRNKSFFRAAIDSARYEVGANQELQSFLENLAKHLDDVNEREYEHFMQFSRRKFGYDSVFHYHYFNGNDVVNADSGHLRQLLDCKIERKTFELLRK